MRNRNFWKLILVTFALWTLFGVITALQYHVNTAPAERAAYPFSRWITLTLSDNWLKAALTVPLLFALSQLHRRVRRWLPRLAFYVLLLLGFTSAHVIFRPAVVPLVATARVGRAAR